jgi:acyl-CoA hydrolase
VSGVNAQVGRQIDAQTAAVHALRSQIDSIARAVQQPQSEVGDDSVSYSFGALDTIEQAAQKLAETVNDLLMKLKPVATIETTRGELKAITTLNYAGRAASVWPEFPTEELKLVHMTNVDHVLALRAALAGAIGSVAGAMMAISASAANPLLAMNALGAVRRLKESLEQLAAAAEAAM